MSGTQPASETPPPEAPQPEAPQPVVVPASDSESPAPPAAGEGQLQPPQHWTQQPLDDVGAGSDMLR